MQPEMSLSTHERGRAAEVSVSAFLEMKGYKLLARNYSVAHLGELDLVMRRAQTQADKTISAVPMLTVVEVKARQDSVRYGGAVAALTPAKLKRIRLATLHFQQKFHFMNNSVELLAALVQLDKQGHVQNIEIIPIEWQ